MPAEFLRITTGEKERRGFLKRLLFVVNPCAGMKRVNRFLPELIALFTANGYENIVYMTAGRGDATDIVARRAKDVDLVVCAGGDGTFNEVVAGMLQSGVQRPIGYIPAGSTNDFASSLGLPKQIMDAARCIMEGTPHNYDIGRFNDRYFSYVASFGAFTRASYSTPQSVKNALGHLAYILEGIRDIPNIHKIHLRIETDNQTFEDDYLFGAVSNSTSVGGILTLDPSVVDMNDGLFEILLIKSPSNAAGLNECIMALSSQKYNSRAISFCTTRHARIYADPAMDWTLDGEMAKGDSVIEVENLYNAITLLKKD